MSEIRVGLGFDIHQLIRGRELWLGGVHIPYDEGLDGHSDADVLLHSLCDALLGAAGLSDIGHYFPPGDPQWRNAGSSTLVERVMEELRSRHWAVANVDMVVIAESPRVAPYIDKMKLGISALLHIPVDAVGIKATTAEQMGALGRREGIAAQAVCLLTRSPGIRQG